jgi:hypothetical protein
MSLTTRSLITLDTVNVVDAFNVGRYLCPRSAQKNRDWEVGELGGFVIFSSKYCQQPHQTVQFYSIDVTDDSVDDELFCAPPSLANVLMVAWKDSV